MDTMSLSSTTLAHLVAGLIIPLSLVAWPAVHYLWNKAVGWK